MKIKLYFVCLSLLTSSLSGLAQVSMVDDIYPGSTGSTPKAMAELNSKLYFVGRSDTSGYSLFVYDGVNAPHVVVSGNYWDFINTDERKITVYNNKLYFAATDLTNGNELWSYDGTNPPALVADINSGASGSSPFYPTVYNNKLYFSAWDGVNGTELWSYDGTTASMIELKPGSDGSTPRYLIVHNNKLNFIADTASGAMAGSRNLVWEYDGTNSSVVGDINPGGFKSLQYTKVFNNKLYFIGDNGAGQQLWSYNGSVSMVTNNIGVANLNPYFTVYNNNLYFSVYDGTNGYELWSYDGTNTPAMVQDLRTGSSGAYPNYTTVYDNKLYFSANDGSTGYEVWTYNGTAFSMIADINSGSASSNPTALITFNSKLYFSANNGTDGNELWVHMPCVPTAATISPSVCGNNYISPSGIYTWTASATYMDTIPNAAGCDSVLTINLTVNPATVATISPAVCGSNYTSPSGIYTWTASATYMDTIPNLAGCDSVLTINLIVNASATTSTVSPSACNSYLSPSGLYTWTSSATYTDTIPAAAGCDSIITINLTINTINKTVNQAAHILTANEAGGMYRWLDCNNSYAALSGATSQIYTATINGSYAVEVTKNGCIDTSACAAVTTIGISTFDKVGNFTMYPNPVSNYLTIDNLTLGSSINIYDALGRVVYENHNVSSKINIDVLSFSNGVYSVSQRWSGFTSKRMLVVNR